MGKDRFINGALAGLLAGLGSNMTETLISWLGTVFWRDLDFAALLMFGHRPENTAQIILAFIGQLIFSMMVGIIFSYLLPVFKHHALLFKSWLYSLVVWFSTYSIVHLFGLPEVSSLSTATIIANGISASVFGIILGILLERFNQTRI